MINDIHVINGDSLLFTVAQKDGKQDNNQNVTFQNICLRNAYI